MMKPGGRFLAATLALLLVPAPGSAQDHVVSAGDVHARLVASAAERASNLAAVDSALATPAAAQAAAISHVDLDRVRRRMPSLTNDELRDVAARAQLLTIDPVAGDNPIVIVLAVIGAFFVLLLGAWLVACSVGHCGD